jgi:hypothetical protein
MTKGEVNQLERELRSKPGLAARELAAVRGRLAVDSSMRKGLSSTDPAGAWPPPDEMPRLMEAAATARQIRSAPMYLLGKTGKPSPAAEPDSGGWFVRHGGLWWSLPVIGIVLLAGYGLWLRKRAA